jgi:hypothetical protein
VSTPAPERPLVDEAAVDAVMRRRSALSRYAAPAALTAAGLAAAAAVAARDPHVTGNWPACPFHAATGLWCPGCGSMRALWHLTQGDPVAAFASNPFAVAAGLLLTWTLVLTWVRASGIEVATRYDPLRWRYAATVTGVVVVAFWVLRNLEWFAPLAP